jgi:hypothetical protein
MLRRDDVNRGKVTAALLYGTAGADVKCENFRKRP